MSIIMLYRLSCKKIARAEPFFFKHEMFASTIPLSCIKMSKKMMDFHKSLPRLPVPPLHSSLQKYLRSARPFLTDEEYQNTSKIVKEFGAPGGLGIKLHSALEEKSKLTENWIREWWLNYAYLSVRNSLLSTSSCGLVSNFQDFKTDESHLRYSAKVVAALLNFKCLLDSSLMDVDVMAGYPLDMTHYYDLFAGCRVPGSIIDSHSFTYFDDKPQDHIVVAHNNHFFSCKAIGDDGEPFSEDQLYTQFKIVVHQSQEADIPIGLLTTLDRDKYYKAYKTLREYDSVNDESVNTIQKALFILCLDKPATSKDMPNRKAHISSHTIHGGGLENNSGNRWFDNLQVIVNRDGTFTITFEHSVSDGQIFIRVLEFIYDYIKGSGTNESGNLTSAPDPKKLKFNASRKSIEDIEEAKKDLKSTVNDLDATVLTFKNYGMDFIKAHKLSSDSYLQMALQLAYYKIHGEASATYESASTRKFLFGRTDVIRSTSVESVEFCRKMLDKSATPSSKIAALRDAINVHKEYSHQAINGLALDRFLLGLKLIALESGMDEPVLFKDIAFTKSTYFKLSTSQVPFMYEDVGVFIAVVPDGYGSCYNIKPSSIILSVTAHNSCQNTSADDFSNAMRGALTEMQDVIAKS